MSIGPGSAPVPAPRRHTFGWPAGSVRALLALLVVGLTCALILLSPVGKPATIPPYLLYLLFMIIGNYFAVRGHVHQEHQPPPLHLPKGLIRTVLLGGLVTAVVVEYVREPD